MITIKCVVSAENAHDILVSSVAEIQDVLDGTTSVSSGNVIAIAPGTYDLDSVDFSGQPLNVTWISQFSDNRATITRWNLQSAAAAGSFALKQVDIKYNLPTGGAYIFWATESSSSWSIINAVDTPATSILIEDVNCDGGMLPWFDGGRVTHGNFFLNVINGQNVTMRRCDVKNCFGGAKLFSVDTALLEENTIYQVHGDGFNLGNQSGDCQNIIARNNHFHSPTGHPSNLHTDWFQFNTFSSSGNFFRNIEIYGNTATYGDVTPIAQVDRSITVTENSFTSSFTMPLTEHGMETRVNPSGPMTVTMPSAVGNRGRQHNIRYLNTGTGDVTIALDGSDTWNGGAAPTLSSASDFATFVSDGSGNWDLLPNGYRSWFMVRDYSFTGGDLEDGFTTMLDASNGSITMTLPASGSYRFNVSRADNSANTVTIAASGGDTVALNGATETSFTIAPGYGLNIERTGDGDWTATEDGNTTAFIFSNNNAGNWENIKVHDNIIALPGAATVFEDTMDNIQFYNNTIMPFILPDRNADGFIGAYDGNRATVSTRFSGTGLSQNNFHAYRFVYTTYGDEVPSAGNDVLNLSDTDPIPASVTSRFNGTTRNDFVKTARADVISAALAKSGGPLDGTFIGAVGTTASNGHYDWTAGEVNANASLPPPTLAISSPEDGATQIAADATITLTFDQIVEAGTGSITLRSGGAAVEVFDVAAGTGDNGGSVAFSGTDVTITPGANMADAVGHSIRVDATAVVGTIYQTAFAGISDDTTLNFTTASAGLSYASAITDSSNNSDDMAFTLSTTTRGSYVWMTGGEQRIDSDHSTVSSATQSALIAAGSFAFVVDYRLSAGGTADTPRTVTAGLGGTTFDKDTVINVSTGAQVVEEAGFEYTGVTDVSSLYGEASGTVFRSWQVHAQDGTNSRLIYNANQNSADDVDIRRMAIFDAATIVSGWSNTAQDQSDMDAAIAALTP